MKRNLTRSFFLLGYALLMEFALCAGIAHAASLEVGAGVRGVAAQECAATEPRQPGQLRGMDGARRTPDEGGGMNTALAHFERLWAEQQTRPADKRLVWIRGFKAALEVSGCLQMDLRWRVAEAEEQALDDAVAMLAMDADRSKITAGETA